MKELCDIYYQLLKKKNWSLPSEGACATAKFLRFMTMGFEKEHQAPVILYILCRDIILKAVREISRCGCVGSSQAIRHVCQYDGAP